MLKNKRSMKKEIEKAIRETLVIQNKESLKYAVDRVLRLFSVSGSLPINRGKAVFNEVTQELIFEKGENIKIL